MSMNPPYYPIPTPSNILPKYMISNKDSRSAPSTAMSKAQQKKAHRKFLKLTSLSPHEEAFDILFDQLKRLTRGNLNQMSRLLNISRPTVQRWYDGHRPRQWYWPYVLFIILRSNYAILAAQPSKAKGHKLTLAEIAITIGMQRPRKDSPVKQLPADFRRALNYWSQADTDIYQPTLNFSDVEKRLIKECIKHHRVELNEFSLKYGYERTRVRRAAKAVGMTMQQLGFGAEKQAFYSLPSDWDNDFED